MSKKIEFAIENAQSAVTRKLNELKRDAANLVDKLTRLQKDCDEGLAGGDIHINSLGVVQGAAGDIDRACGELRVLQEALKALKWLEESN